MVSVPRQRTYAEDVDCGVKLELQLLPLLNECFQDDFKKLDRYAKMDFEGKTCFLEIKGREGVRSTTYTTMMIPYSKIEFALQASKPVYFLFDLVDGLFYSKFDKVKYLSYARTLYCRKGRADHTDVPQEYIWIPVSDLDWLAMYTQ